MRLRSTLTLIFAVSIAVAAIAPSRSAAFDSWSSSPDVHRAVTRAAVGCPPGVSGDECFQPATLEQLAGEVTGFVGVGSAWAPIGIGGVDLPDFIPGLITAAAPHCDGADYLSTYDPRLRTRADALVALRACTDNMRALTQRAVGDAGALVRPDGSFDPVADAIPAGGCFLPSGLLITVSPVAKCQVIAEMGRALHGVQDFYAHSNYADRAAPRPLGASNPPGLALAAPAALLDLRKPFDERVVPSALTTGCASVVAVFGAQWERRACEMHRCWWTTTRRWFGVPWPVRVCIAQSRVTHADLNKDRGTWSDTAQPATGGTPRGLVERNFARAVEGAITETATQWDSFRARLADTYGVERARRIACVLTRDDPSRACPSADVASSPGLVRVPALDPTPPSVVLYGPYGTTVAQRPETIDAWGTLHVRATGSDPEGLHRLQLTTSLERTCGSAGLLQVGHGLVAPQVVSEDRSVGELATTSLSTDLYMDLSAASGCQLGWELIELTYRIEAAAENFHGGRAQTATLTIHAHPGPPPS